jgi:hypothetical protein
MKKFLLGLVIIAFFFASCSSAEYRKLEQKKWDRDWQGPIISPAPDQFHDRMPL